MIGTHLLFLFLKPTIELFVSPNKYTYLNIIENHIFVIFMIIYVYFYKHPKLTLESHKN